MKYLITTLFVLSMALISCDSGADKVTKPEVLEFGQSMAYIKDRVMPACDSIYERKNEPIQLPTARDSQSQLDCFGYMYAGKKRNLELIFADDALDIIWILTEEEEEQFFIEEFRKIYGEPTHKMDDVTFFLNHGTAVRNKPHEVLFISERLKVPYGEWLKQAQ